MRKLFIIVVMVVAVAGFVVARERAPVEPGTISFLGNTFEPLQGVTIAYAVPKASLPVYLEIATSPTSREKVFSAKIENTTGTIEALTGGKLGTYAVFLRKGSQIASNIPELQLVARNAIVTGIADFDTFVPRIEKIMRHNISYCQFAKGYRSPDTDTIWLRDHVYQMQGFQYWETDMTSMIDFLLQDQQADGMIYDFECPAARIEVEADVEYFAVLGAYYAWQATGDDRWLESILPKLNKALEYTTRTDIRWRADHGLVQRVFTIDTWDFQYGDGSNVINKKSKFGILSGDNSGLYMAAKIVARMQTHFHDVEKATYWDQLADSIKKKSDELLWNQEKGYYRNFLHLDPLPEPIEHEDDILSFSNALTINRQDFTDHEKIVSILSEYEKRGGWPSVTPTYGSRKFGQIAKKSGEYVNGGTMPFIGGELAGAAFDHGMESYGIDQVKKYLALLNKNNDKTYLWYWPDGRPGIYEGTIPTDGWGSSAFLSAFIEGVAGVKDLDRLYNVAQVAPRWLATGVDRAQVVIKYGASDGYVAYAFVHDLAHQEITIKTTGSGVAQQLHVLLPSETMAREVKIDGKPVTFTNYIIEKSHYVDFDSELNAGVRQIVISYQPSKGDTKRYYDSSRPSYTPIFRDLSITGASVSSTFAGEKKLLPGQLVRPVGKEEIYVTRKDGSRKLIVDENAFSAAGYQFKDVWVTDL